MKNRNLSLSLFLPALLAANLAAAGESDCLVDQYLRALEATQQENAGVEDVDTLLDFFAENVVYEHPRVGARIEGKERIRQGTMAFLGKTRNAVIRVENHLGEADVVVVEYDREFEALSEDGWQHRMQHQITLFEIADGKITRVLDYW